MFDYSLKQKLIIKFSQKVMPLISFIFRSDRFLTYIWKCLGVKVGKGSLITADTRINIPFNLEIGNFSIINGYILNREKVVIGNNVELLFEVYISTQSHDLYNGGHLSIYKSVIIEDYCWLAPRSMVMQGVHLKKGSVVAANAVVVASNNSEYDILGGVPAKPIGKRILFNDAYKEPLNASEKNVYSFFQHGIYK